MKITRSGRAASVALVAALALTACGTDNNSDSSSSSNGGASSNSASGSGSSSAGGAEECGTTNLTAEGSTAQGNAIDQVISDYKDQCSSATVTYNGTGSGAGIKQFTAKQVNFAGSDSALDRKSVV